MYTGVHKSIYGKMVDRKSQTREYHKQELTIAKELGDRARERIANTSHTLGNFKQAIEYHNRELHIVKEVGDRAGAGRAFADLGISYHSLGNF